MSLLLLVKILPLQYDWKVAIYYVSTNKNICYIRW